MKQLTEMTSAELTIVQKKINKDSSNLQASVEKDIESLITSLDSPLCFGKYLGRTLRDLIKLDPQYIVWLAENASERISLLPKDENTLNIAVVNMRILSLQTRRAELTLSLGKLTKQLKELEK